MIHPLNARLAAARKELSETLREELPCADAPHYDAQENELLRTWCERLLSEMVAAADGEPQRFARYLQRVALERLEEGFELHELQRALSLLERDAWKLCVEQVPERDELITELEQLTTLVGAAKDALARTYLEAAVRARDNSARLQRRLDQLAKGTDSLELGEELS